MKLHLYGLAGFAGTGKDTVADLLVTHARFRKMAFADALRGELANAFGVSLDVFTHPATKERPVPSLALTRAPQDFVSCLAIHMPSEAINGSGGIREEWLTAPRSPRQIMQLWATEYRRARSPMHWVTVMHDRLAFYRRNGETRFVITDVRFDNEADLVRALGGEIWQVTRPGLDGTKEGAHISANDGTRFKPSAVLANLHDIRHLQGLVLAEFCAREVGVQRSNVFIRMATA